MSDRKHWRVSVETSGETIVSIEPEMLAGREISDEDEVLIRTAAHHLLSFIGDPTPPPQHISVGSDAVTLREAAQALLDAQKAGQQHVGYRLDLWSALEAAIATSADAHLLADANSWYSAAQLDEIEQEKREGLTHG